MRRLAAACAFVVLLAACGPTGRQATIYDQTNLHRDEAGVPRLGWSQNLATFAQAWSAHMVLDGAGMVHSDLHVLLDQYPALTACAENLAVVPTNYSAEQIVHAWLSSPQHYANVLGPYSQTGIGVTFDGVGGEWVDAVYCQ